MNFPTAVKTCLSEKFATFSGRASRSEYWWFVLAYILGGIIVSFLWFWLYVIYILALIVPAAAVGYRRLQDTGRAGWYIFIPMGLGLLITFLTPSAPMMDSGQMSEMGDVGQHMGRMGLLAVLGVVQLIVGLVFLWWLTRPSQPEINQYGPPPAP